ncbi:MAG: serine hydrolase [Slackia sp.]
MRDSYDTMGFDEWATGVGADDATYRADSWYPWYCARSSAKLWTEMYNYLESNTETATYLSALLGQTETSFIRDALQDTNALVKDKAGWCSDSDPNYNGVCDAGIVSVDGHPFVLSVMTGMADSEQNRLLFQEIARSVFETNETLSA